MSPEKILSQRSQITHFEITITNATKGVDSDFHVCNTDYSFYEIIGWRKQKCLYFLGQYNNIY